MATELIFGGVLAELMPQEAVALLAALVFQVCGWGAGCCWVQAAGSVLSAGC